MGGFGDGCSLGRSQVYVSLTDGRMLTDFWGCRFIACFFFVAFYSSTCSDEVKMTLNVVILFATNSYLSVLLIRCCVWLVANLQPALCRYDAITLHVCGISRRNCMAEWSNWVPDFRGVAESLK